MYIYLEESIFLNMCVFIQSTVYNCIPLKVPDDPSWPLFTGFGPQSLPPGPGEGSDVIVAAVRGLARWRHCANFPIQS